MNNAEFASLVMRASHGSYQPQGDPIRADCIAGFGMGYRRIKGVVSPGLGNQALAEFIVKYYPELPRFAQEDLAVALHELEPAPTLAYGAIGHRNKTKDIKEPMLAGIRSREFERPLVVASRYHVPRVVAMMAKSGWPEVIVPPDLPAALDPKSAMWWTRGQLRWMVKEPLVLAYYRRIGLI